MKPNAHTESSCIQAMQWMLSRIMTLNLLSLYSLMFALFVKTHTTLKVMTMIRLLLKSAWPTRIETPLNFFQGSSWLQDAEWLFAYRRWFQMSLKLLPNCENFSIGGSTVLAMAESVECFPIPVPCHILKVCSPNTHALSFSSHCSFLTLLIPVGMLLRSWWWWFVRSFTRPIVWWPAHT